MNKMKDLNHTLPSAAASEAGTAEISGGGGGGGAGTKEASTGATKNESDGFVPAEMTGTKTSSSSPPDNNNASPSPTGNIGSSSGGGMDWILHNYNANTTEGPDIDAELSRLQVLKSFQLLDEAADVSYDRLASVAARIFEAPMALINLVDLGRLWQVASFGLSTTPTEGATNSPRMMSNELQREMPRVTSLCAHTILQKEFLLVVPDLRQDARFCHSPWARAGICFYAGTPLISPEGAHIGSLCVLDTQPRAALGEEQQEQLVDLAAAVMDLMAEKRARLLSAQAPEFPGVCFSHDVQRAATFLRQQLRALKDDGDFQTVASDSHRHALQSAYDSADFLCASLVPAGEPAGGGGAATATASLHHDNSTSSGSPGAEPADLMSHQQNDAHSSSSSSPPRHHNHHPTKGIGEHKAMDMDLFVKSLETAMEAFPRKVHLSFTVHPDLPTEDVWFNDLKVFRSAIALLTSACERTQEGFVRFKIYPRKEGGGPAAAAGAGEPSQPQQQQQRVLVFECEDTGRDVDLERFESLFQPPTDDDGSEVGYEECIRVDGDTGQVTSMPFCEDNNNSGGGNSHNSNGGAVAGGFAVHAVAGYIGSMGGKYGFRPRFVQNDTDDTSTGSIFWFSIPLRTAMAVTTHGGTTSVLDSVVDSVLGSAPLSDTSQDIRRVESTATRTWF